jgi:glyoxylase-like metal-dependent hydrolase (beta-lactamase superfamily II)
MGLKRPSFRAEAIAGDVYWLPVKGCNVYLVGSPSRWVLIDTGWPNSAATIRSTAGYLFGPSARPAAILLTHAHPDHFGSAAELAQAWDLPVYLHPDDLPYLRGGVIPHDLLDPVGRVFIGIQRVLPASMVELMTSSPLKGVPTASLEPDAGIPGLPDWECIPVPGHSPGHVAFFRRRDRVLLAGDAVLTAPLWGLLPAVQRLSHPPWMVSWDWELTKASTAAISRLEPRVLATGHGVPMTGKGVARELVDFAGRFSGGA